MTSPLYTRSAYLIGQHIGTETSGTQIQWSVIQRECLGWSDHGVLGKTALRIFRVGKIGLHNGEASGHSPPPPPASNAYIFGH
jgi:hypothetical protein